MRTADLEPSALREQRKELARTVPVKHCAYCGKRMRQLTAEYIYRTDEPPYRRIIGYRPASHWYDPFCTLKCAWSFGDAAYKAGYRIQR